MCVHSRVYGCMFVCFCVCVCVCVCGFVCSFVLSFVVVVVVVVHFGLTKGFYAISVFPHVSGWTISRPERHQKKQLHVEKHESAAGLGLGIVRGMQLFTTKGWMQLFTSGTKGWSALANVFIRKPGRSTRCHDGAAFGLTG